MLCTGFQKNNVVNYDAPARWPVYDQSDRQACAHTRARHQRSSPTHTHTHTHTFHSFTHTDTGTLNLYYLHSREHTILSVPFNIIIFLNEYFVIFIYKSIQTRFISLPTPPLLPNPGWLKRLAARGKVGMLQTSQQFFVFNLFETPLNCSSSEPLYIPQRRQL